MRLARSALLVFAVLAVTAAPVLGFTVAPSSGAAIAAPAAPGSGDVAPFDVLPYLLPAIGAIRIKATADLAKKFVRNASAASGDYTAGVQAAGGDWEANARAGAGNYQTGVQQAITDGRFERGIAAAGQAKYVQRASTLGAQRFPTGVGAAEGDWSKGTQPYLDALKSIELPPRRPKGDPSNLARAAAVATKLRAMKTGK